MMYERTTHCPYKDQCESHSSITRIENELHNLRRNIQIHRNSIDSHEYERKMDDIRKKLQRINRSREKCHNSYKRCLRYWLFKKNEDIKLAEQSLVKIPTQSTSEPRARSYCLLNSSY